MGGADVFFVQGNALGRCSLESTHRGLISLHLPTTGRRVYRRRLTNASRTPHDAGTLGAPWYSLRAERATVVYVHRFDAGSRLRRARAARSRR